MTQAYSELKIVDPGAPAAKQIVMYGGMVGSVGAGLQRKHTLMFAWRDGRYRLASDIADVDDHPYFRILDANAALAAKDYDRALERAMGVLQHPEAFASERYGVSVSDQARITAYAAGEAMLVYALRGDVRSMQTVLNQAVPYSRPDNPYVDADRKLLQTYQATRDPVAACRAMANVVRPRLDQAQFFQYYGYAMERLPLRRVCPLEFGGESDDVQL